MSDYLNAYKGRMERVDAMLRKAARELTDRGYLVYHSKRSKIEFLVVCKDDKNLTIEFAEVPYRWVIYNSIKPSKDKGSSIIRQVFSDPDSLYPIDTILKYLGDDHDPGKTVEQIDSKMRFLERFK